MRHAIFLALSLVSAFTFSPAKAALSAAEVPASPVHMKRNGEVAARALMARLTRSRITQTSSQFSPANPKILEVSLTTSTNVKKTVLARFDQRGSLESLDWGTDSAKEAARTRVGFNENQRAQLRKLGEELAQAFLRTIVEQEGVRGQMVSPRAQVAQVVSRFDRYEPDNLDVLLVSTEPATNLKGTELMNIITVKFNESSGAPQSLTLQELP